MVASDLAIYNFEVSGELRFWRVACVYMDLGWGERPM